MQKTLLRGDSDGFDDFSNFGGAVRQKMTSINWQWSNKLKKVSTTPKTHNAALPPPPCGLRPGLHWIWDTTNHPTTLELFLTPPITPPLPQFAPLAGWGGAPPGRSGVGWRSKPQCPTLPITPLCFQRYLIFSPSRRLSCTILRNLWFFFFFWRGNQEGFPAMFCIIFCGPLPS